MSEVQYSAMQAQIETISELIVTLHEQITNEVDAPGKRKVTSALLNGLQNMNTTKKALFNLHTANKHVVLV